MKKLILSEYENLQKTITQAKTVLHNLEEAIKKGDLNKYATTSVLNKIIDLDNKIESVKSGRNIIQYPTVSTSVSPTEMPTEYDFKHLKKQGMGCILVIMVNVTSNTDAEPEMMDMSRIKKVIAIANSKGVKIQMLKPHIGLKWSDGYNRKNYAPTDIAKFFENWQNVLKTYAALCVQYNIPMLCMSCEMSKMTDNKYLSYWKDTYEAVKNQYPNLLLLHAPKTGDFNDPNCNKTWQYSDILGVNVYLSYTYKRFTNDEEGLDVKDIAKGFYEDQRTNKVIYNINTLADKYKKPVFITEIGCMPWDDGLIDVRCEKKVRNWYVPKYLAEAAVTYLCNNKHVIGFSWWHTNSPFNYYSDDEDLPLEKYFRKTFGGGM